MLYPACELAPNEFFTLYILYVPVVRIKQQQQQQQNNISRIVVK
jgi:hypothetical protein